MFTSFLARPTQDDVLVVGLGGGGMVRFLNHQLPATRVDAVEIDPEVVAVARDLFGTRPNGSTNIFTEDALGYLARSEKRYDVIYMDAFLSPGEGTGGEGIPLRLKTIAFLKSLHHDLKPGGAVAFNLIQTASTPDDISAIAEAFPSAYRFNQPATSNLTVIASLKPQVSRSALAATATELDSRDLLGFPLAPLLDFSTPVSPQVP
jgi:spermidine synthase